MATTTRHAMEHMGKTQGAENHDHDLIQDLSKRLDALWRYDQYIANAEESPSCRSAGATSRTRSGRMSRPSRN